VAENGDMLCSSTFRVTVSPWNLSDFAIKETPLMQTLRVIFVAALLSIFCGLANAQSSAMSFSALPVEAQASISAALTGEIPLPGSQLAKLTSSDGQANDLLGASVAVSGETVVVGISSNARNEAYVFVKPASGWGNLTETAKLTPSAPQAGAFFGLFVAISGDTVVVSAPEFNGGQGGQDGRVYVYVKPSGGWRDMTETAQLSLPSDPNGSLLGHPVTVAGNTVVAGAPNKLGAAEVYVRPRRGWRSTSKPTATLQPPSDTQVCTFCLAATANTVVIGTSSEGNNEGSAYVFAEPAGGWRSSSSPTAKLVASNPSLELGVSVGINSGGDTVVAGAPGNNSAAGAIYVFVKPAGGWVSETQAAELTVPNSFGIGLSVAISGNMVVAGSPSATVGVNQYQGAVYEFVKPAKGWKNKSKPNTELTASDGAQGDQFGTSVAINNGTIVSGAPFATVGSSLQQGAAYVFAK
jgi:FG-GAP repeat protein